MPKNRNKTPYTLYVFHLPLLVGAVVMFVVSTFVSNKATTNYRDSGTILGSKSEKGSSSKSGSKSVGNGKKDDTNDKQNINKGNSVVSQGKATEKGEGTNARQHKENIETVVEELNEVAEEEEQVGNVEVSEEIEDVATTEDENVEDATEAINAVESRSKWQTLLFGSDYKNLGQLRSSLAHNTNSIRKLVRTSGSIQGEENQLRVQEQLQTMYQERERLMSVITENESQFSILGWVVKLLTGYSDDPIDDGDIDEGDIDNTDTGPDGSIGSPSEPDESIDSGTNPGGDVSDTVPGDEASETTPQDTLTE